MTRVERTAARYMRALEIHQSVKTRRQHVITQAKLELALADLMRAEQAAEKRRRRK